MLGLATGSTPRRVYRLLVEMYRSGALSFAHVTTFNLDEYWPMQPQALQSYRRFMQVCAVSLHPTCYAQTRISKTAWFARMKRNLPSNSLAHF